MATDAKLHLTHYPSQVQPVSIILQIRWNLPLIKSNPRTKEWVEQGCGKRTGSILLVDTTLFSLLLKAKIDFFLWPFYYAALSSIRYLNPSYKISDNNSALLMSRTWWDVKYSIFEDGIFDQREESSSIWRWAKREIETMAMKMWYFC